MSINRSGPVKFLLLRPQAKYQKSSQRFLQAGLNTVGLGLIDTVTDQQALSQLAIKIGNLDPDSMLIVTSTVAAELITQGNYQWPDEIKIFAVGNSTGQILANNGFKPIIPDQASTEGLLALPELNQVQQKKIIVIKGHGGRKDLIEQLCQRQAKVEQWQLYKRVSVSTPNCTEDWQAEQINCIIATSGELIEAAFEHFDSNWLQTVSWIVVSKRTADMAAKLGIDRVFISSDASDDALIRCAKHISERA
ncbi:MAG: uroporphyrinogen-III synthase [Paraglaciecola sp.]|jgi:uroporphyrinogen-III synthase